MDNKPTFLQLLPLYGRVCWALLVAFAFVGDLLGNRHGAVVVALITAVMWVLVRIVTEGMAAYRVIRIARSLPKDRPSDAGKVPPAPPPGAAT